MGWLSWFCPGINLKRWLLLFTVGVILSAFSLAIMFNDRLLVMIEELLFRMSYLTTGHYSGGFTFFVGLIGIGFGMAIMFYATRRLVRSIMEVVVPEQNYSLLDTIFTQRKLSSGPAVTVIGGGTGLSTLLRGMKFITNNCTAVVTVADDGGSSGRLRHELGIIPPGDLRNCLVALADREPLMERVMQYRFKGDSSLAGHNLGNLFIAGISDTEGGVVEGLEAASQILKVRGNVVPSTLSDIQIEATMTDGSVILGESEITDAHKTIETLRMVPPDAPATKGAVEAILKADMLILGPGSLYTSVLPNLLVPGIKEAIAESKAIKVYICNVMTQRGETDGYGAADHIRVIKEYMGGVLPDYVIVNDEPVSEEMKELYRSKGQEVVSPDIEELEAMGVQVIATKLVSNSNRVRHNSRKLAQIIMIMIYRLKLLGGGLVFFDYIFLRHSLKHLKKSLPFK